MRLRRYISEIEIIDPDEKNIKADPDEIKTVKNNCKPIIDLYRKLNPTEGSRQGHPVTKALWRGVGRKAGEYGGIDYIRRERGNLKDRTPRDTPQFMHDWLNEYFKKEFGWPVRNGVSTTADYNTARTYASSAKTTYIFFPVGKPEFCYSLEVEDSTTDLTATVSIHTPKDWDIFINTDLPFSSMSEHGSDRQRDYFWDRLKSYTNKNLEKAITGKGRRGVAVEVMFKSPTYYLVSPEVLHEILS